MWKRSVWARDLVAAVLGLAMVAGVYIDGWAHVTRPGLETFFTPWHGLLYGAFTLLAAFLVLVSLHREGEGGWRLRPPAGYGLGLAGVAVFATGGVLDMLWHEVFGIEVAIDALLSPTHLVLLAGGMLMVSTAMRSAARAPQNAGIPAVISMATIAALAGFFLSYVSVFTDPGAAGTLTTLPEGTPGHREAEMPAIAGLGGYLVSTAVLLVPLLAARRLGLRLPRGSVTATVAAVALLGSMLSDFTFLAAAAGAVAGAAVAETLWQLRPSRLDAWTLLGAILPLAVWGGQLSGLAVSKSVGWPVELWAGVMVLTMFAGAVLAWITGPRAADSTRIATVS